MRKFFAATVLASASLLVGCASSIPDGSTLENKPLDIRIHPHYVDLPDGRTVLCVFERSISSAYSGGPSCDWNNASRKEK